MATNDFTNWGLFWYSYYRIPKNWWDSAIQTVMGNAYYTHFLYRIFSLGGSAVNSGTTNILLSYSPNTSFIKSIDDDDIPDDMKKTAIADRFRAASLFFAYLSSVVYESPEILLRVTNKWEIEVQTIHKIDHSSAAYVCTVNRKNENAVVLVFKGTSPFNFTEWASDFGIGLVRPNDELCNRDDSEDIRIHGGFWNTIFGNEGQHDHKYWNSIIEAVNGAVNKIHGETHAKVPIYVTGHSLGAALATVAHSVLVHSPEQLSKKAKLAGAFTYGTPNVGNFSFKDNYDRNLETRDVKHFRIGCANDIVSVSPRSYQNGGVAITLNHNRTPTLGVPSICRKVANYFSALISFPRTFGSLRNEFLEAKPQKQEIDSKNLIETEYYVNNLLTRDITNYNGEQESYERKTNALGYCYKVLAPSWLFDHFPSEYIEHIEKAKWSEIHYKSLKF